MNVLSKNFSRKILEAGVDEAGRGCLAGPVVAAAVILPCNFSNDFLRDSKKISEKKRNALKEIIEKTAIAYGIGIVNAPKIDEINILQASILAMHRALENLKITPEFIIVDGNTFNPYKKIPHQTIVKGDDAFLSIAAASVLAKTHRDALMQKLHKAFPEYGWNKNKGYPTKKHRMALENCGTNAFHRKSFQLFKKKELSLPFEKYEK